MADPRTITARRGTRRQPEASRTSILRAALTEFAQEGLAGARTDAIAAAAGVNKALLYYYFRDKEALYDAVLDEFFVRLLSRVTEAFDGEGPAGERLLTYARAHFDCIAESPHYARLFQGELMSAGSGRPSHLTRVVEQYIRPISVRLLAVLQEGVAAGEFRSVDPTQFAPSIVGMIVHYFVVAPVARKLFSQDPFSPQALQRRRAAVLDFIAAALFANQPDGLRLAAKVASRNELQSGAGSKRTKAPQSRLKMQGKLK
jgi:TetR/AcrR family transcriptional regulator